MSTSRIFISYSHRGNGLAWKDLNPARRFTKQMLPERLRVRYRRLIGLLQGKSDIRRNPKKAERDLKAIDHCRFALSPVPMPNVFIIGESIAYEGMKRAETGGFEMTHCETDPVALQEMIEQFDLLFEESHKETLRLYPTNEDLGKQLQNFYNEADELETKKL